MRKSASSDVSNSIISIAILVLRIATVLFTESINLHNA